MGIDPAHFGSVPGGIIFESDLNFFGFIDHVAVGQDVTFFPNDHARALGVRKQFTTWPRAVFPALPLPRLLLALFLLALLLLELLTKLARNQIPRERAFLVQAGVRLNRIRLVGHANHDHSRGNLVGHLDESLIQLPG